MVQSDRHIYTTWLFNLKEKHHVLLLAMTFQLFVYTSSHSQTLDSLSFMNKLFECNGGLDNWRKVETLKRIVVFTEYAGQIPTGKNEIELSFKLPNKLKCYSMKEGSLNGFTMALCDSVFWTKFDFGVVEILPTDQMKYFRSTMFFGYPLIILKKGMKINYLGQLEFNGETFYALKLKEENWVTSIVLYINPTTFLIDYVSNEKNIIRYTKLSDYRFVNNILFPFKEEGFKSGGDFPESISEVINLEVNGSMSDEFFVVPK